MLKDPSNTEKELLKRIAEGDDKSFSYLFHAHWDHIYSVAYSITKSSTLAEDLVQDIFSKIWTSRKKLIAIERFDDYLFIIARNTIYTALRRQSRSDSFVRELMRIGQAAGQTPEEELSAKQSHALIQEAIRQLSPQQQSVYRLSREEGLKYDQIAEKLGISKNTVRIHMIKALEFLRQYLNMHRESLLLAFFLFFREKS